ncbi:hypothetical protein BDV40DRAFT_308078 [Aspergillus tamarii]|uniref:FAD/NAD(P)-binding domain-containing protein n=1 Tax=Aspergillus tamarii TaxID=41984 RepID=A0A5N6V5Z8_ASPTM|nr:hypothetical protein BDV40DRAFT_308078 [Aspergillus tamarii]
MLVPALNPSAPTNGETLEGKADALNEKYEQEKLKRLRSDGNNQYVEIESVDRFRALAVDRWVDHAKLNSQPANLKDGDNIKILILGAGYGGLLYAIRFIQAGFQPKDIRLVDVAGGFGGTWYWNRYPGLMCDVESYTYMPLLEETGYMPKHKYAYGPELLEYATIMARHWDLEDKGVFRSQIKTYEWNEATRRWNVEIHMNRGLSDSIVSLKVSTQFVVLANGILNHPKVAKNLQDFEGDMFHTARWNYDVTGGSPTQPTLTGLKGTRVGIIGTGATAVQVVPQVAKWAKELYVFQRTPAAVGERGQRETNLEEWKNVIAREPGWQRRRVENFHDYLGNDQREEDLVNDGWTHMKSFEGVAGKLHDPVLLAKDVPGHIKKLILMDVERSSDLRERVRCIVNDAKTAASLMAWYPGWCKRPTFHDDYLPSFNLPHVHLVDTDGKGVDYATKDALVVSGTEYPLDVLVLSTGYRAPSANLGEPSVMSDVTVRGRNGRLLSEKWNAKGAATLHGVLTHDFPNFFITGPAQTGNTSNLLYIQNVLSQHCAYIAAKATADADKFADRVAVEVTVDAEEEWSSIIAAESAWYAPLSICTPSYITNEGSVAEDQEKMKRALPYPQGMNMYTAVLEEWRAEGSMRGVEVTVD